MEPLGVGGFVHVFSMSVYFLFSGKACDLSDLKHIIALYKQAVGSLSWVELRDNLNFEALMECNCVINVCYN